MQRALLYFASSSFLHHCQVYAYPLIFSLNANEKKCFNYNIPEDDDATFLVVALPGDSESDSFLSVQDYYVEEFDKVTNEFRARRRKKMFGKLSDELEEKIAQENLTRKQVIFSYFREDSMIDHQSLIFYRPYTLFNIADLSSQKGYDDYLPLDGFKLCHHNLARDPVTMMLDVSHWSQSKNDDYADDTDDREVRKKKIVKVEHITPLESNFKDVLLKMRRVVKEYDMIEAREHRNLKNDQFAQSVVSKFSYLGLVVLIITAWFQVRYLKSYFKKKKLL